MLAGWGFDGYRATDGGQISQAVSLHKFVPTLDQAIGFAAAAQSDIADGDDYARGLLHAFPTLRGPRDAARAIDGAPPSPRSPPPGCRFHPRCGLADARCGLEAPPWVTWPADPTRQVACHHAGALEGGTP